MGHETDSLVQRFPLDGQLQPLTDHRHRVFGPYAVFRNSMIGRARGASLQREMEQNRSVQSVDSGPARRIIIDIQDGILLAC